MGAITINTVLDSVITRLSSQYPDIEIYEDEGAEEQGSPYFLVQLQQASQNQELGRRYQRSHTFDIRYVAPAKNNREKHSLAEQLYDVMELIEIGGSLCRGRSMNHRIEDGILHFFIDYELHVRRDKAEPPKMQELEQEGYIREGQKR